MQHWTVLELNRLIRNTLDGHLQPAYWVAGEIADMRINARGHCYFELVEKEDDRITARIRANIWSYTFRSLAPWFEVQSGQPLKNGLQVLCKVNVSFHELYGLSLNVTEIDPRFTMGERARKRLEIIQKLKDDGVFDMNRMHALPNLPRRIALISSSTAAGFGDFMDQLNNNPYGYAVNVTLFNSVMQGDQAPGSIITALGSINDSIDKFDIVMILRGGGAQVDLDCFDTYDLANHVAQFPLPVIAGIGHERDETIIDLVSHTSVKTPTAAAEFIISGIRRAEEKIAADFRRLVGATENRFRLADRETQNLGFRLRTATTKTLTRAGNFLDSRKQTLRNAARNKVIHQKNRMDIAEKSLEYINPAKVLQRGYTLTLVNGKAASPKTSKPGDTVETLGSTYTMYSTIKEINSNE